ncbi:hypothetical protein L0U85_18575, partial [Glycomyces sp. L485]
PAPASQTETGPESGTGPEHGPRTGTGPERDSEQGSGPGGCSRPEDEHASTPATPPAAAQAAAMRLVHPKTNEPLIPVR